MEYDYNNEVYKKVKIDLNEKKENAQTKKAKYLSFKRKRRNSISEAQKVLNEVRKAKNRNNIPFTLQKMGIDANEQGVVDYYKALVTTGNTIKSLNLKSNLLNKEIIFPFFETRPVNVGITNDLLLNQYNLTNAIWNNQSTRSSYLIRAILVDKVRVANLTFMELEKEDEIKEYYIQDYDSRISCPFETGIDFKKPNENDDSFWLGGAVYHVYKKPNFVIIFYSTAVENAAASVLKNSIKIYDEKGKLKTGFKKLGKKGKAYFFDKELKVTNFCPSYLNFSTSINKNIQFGFAYRVIFSAASFHEAVLADNNNVLKFPETFVTFDNIEQVYDFLRVTALLVDSEKSIFEESLDNLNADIKKIKKALDPFVNIYNKYEGREEIFKLYNDYHKKFQNICCSFIDSFTYNVNLDKINQIIKKIDEFSVIAKQIELDVELKNKIKEVIEGNPYCVLIKNFINLSPNPSSIVEIIRQVCYDTTKITTDSSKIENNLRAVGYQIYEFFLGRTQQIFYTIRSPFAFLGNVIGTNTVENIQDVLNSLVEQSLRLSNLDRLEKVKLMTQSYASMYKMIEGLNKEVERTAATNEYLDKINTEVILLARQLIKELGLQSAPKTRKKPQSFEVMNEILKKEKINPEHLWIIGGVKNPFGLGGDLLSEEGYTQLLRKDDFDEETEKAIKDRIEKLKKDNEALKKMANDNPIFLDENDDGRSITSSVMPVPKKDRSRNTSLEKKQQSKSVKGGK